MPSLYEEKLLESGLTVEDAKVLKIQPLSALESVALSSYNKNKPALKLNYLDPYGAPLSDTPGSIPYWRLRYVWPKLEGFDKNTKPQRYSNLPRTVPVAYWPQNFDWSPVMDDVSVPVVMVEGELKAAKSCKEGFATIGLAGVYNWLSRRRGHLFLDSLKYLNYLKRDIYICFDDDYILNKSMVQSMTVLTEELTKHGAYVHVITIPSVPSLKEKGKKTGLDDYLVYCGDEAAKSFNVLIAKAQPIGLIQPLFDMNKKYVVLSNPGCVYEKYTQGKHKIEMFKNLLEAGNTTLVRIPEAAEKGDDNAKYKYKEVSVADKWLSWPLHDRCDSLVYSPGNGEYIEKTLRGEKYIDYNCWQGWGAKPVEGDVSLFLELIDFLFKDAETKHKEWFLQWLAYPIQHPGAKLYTACVLHGTKHGTGKTLVGYTVGGIYGENYKEANQTALEADFHKPFMNRQFILGDEITGSDQRKFGDKLKQYITGHEILINEKFIPQYYINNCINFYFTSNHPDAFYLEDTDRRFFIHKTPDYTLDEAFYKKYERWYRTQDTPPKPRPEAMNALMYYFLHIDTSSFNPHKAAPNTQSKTTMLELSKSDLGTWVHDAKNHPDVILERSGRDIFSSKELLLIYDPMEKTKVKPLRMNIELTKAEVPMANHGRKIKAKNKVVVYFILRNKEKWLSATVAEITAHINNTPAFVNADGGKY